MGFEALPDDIDSFFKTGELPDSMKGEVTQPVTPVESPAQVEQVSAPADQTETPVEQPVITPPAAPDAFLVQQLNESRQQLNDLTGKLNKLLEEKERLEAPQAPDLNTDPLGHMMFHIKNISERIQSIEQGGTQKSQADEQQKQIEQLSNAVKSGVNEFKTANPDYDAASEFVTNRRLEDLRAMGMNDQQAIVQARTEFGNMAVMALQSGKNPAKVMYDMAGRYGYKKQEAPPPAGTKLDMIKEGQKASQHVTRSSQPAPVSLEAAKSASDRDLNDMVANHWDEMLGRPKGVI